MKYILLLFMFNVCLSYAQDSVLVIGNYTNVCFDGMERVKFIEQNELPTHLDSFQAILIFSNAQSNLLKEEIEHLLCYVENGGGLYCGAENLPFQTEFNSITTMLFEKTAWGNFSSSLAEVAENGFLNVIDSTRLNAGNTTVAVPLDFKMNVELWIDDQPLMTSLVLGRGRIVFDGGYSRFYCPIHEQSKAILKEVIRFLSNHP